ncbi:MBL fold metallo-hydrolase [Roseomonas chloroacetimidivorans]|uniref:MBL fold metallo-hydrolase n=1 Tax=Roseomonas chloroacetimidivorans TaxID=1766656 RepID=UPI003C76A025
MSLAGPAEHANPAIPAGPPPLGATLEIVPGLHWARMPLPFPPWHVNLWLIEDGQGWLAVDAGVNSATTLAAWEDIFERVLGGRPITRVLLTHFHPDHAGLGGWLCERWDAPLLMARAEFLQARVLLLDGDERLREQHLNTARNAGAPAEFLQYLSARGGFYQADVVPLPRAYRPIHAGQIIQAGSRNWQVRVGEGHAPAMTLLHCPALGILIAADQVLPRISPFIGVQGSEPEEDPLRNFLASLEDLKEIKEGTLCLPSHGEPFGGLHARIAALTAHHAERLSSLLQACAKPITAFDAARLMFPHVTAVSQMGFMIGEALAHLHYLRSDGLVMRDRRSDGAFLYRQTSG